MLDSEYILIARMSAYPRLNDIEMALDYLNQFVVAGILLEKALENVSFHFTGISVERLHNAWNKLG